MKNCNLSLLKQRINELDYLANEQIARILLQIGDYKYAVLKDTDKFMKFLKGKLLGDSNKFPSLFQYDYFYEHELSYIDYGCFIYQDHYGHHAFANHIDYIVFNDKDEAISKFDRMVKDYINSLEYCNLFAPNTYNYNYHKSVDYDYTHFRQNLKEQIDNTQLVLSESYLKLFDEKVEQLLKEHEEKVKLYEADKKEKEAKKLEALSKLSDEDKLALGL